MDRYFIILFCFILFCFVLFCFILLSFVLFCFVLHRWFTGDHSIFADPLQKHTNNKNYNAKPIWKASNQKIGVRFNRWKDEGFQLALWNVQKFSPIGQSLSNKNEGTHGWSYKFYKYFVNQINYKEWQDIQIILLANKCLSRCYTLINDQYNDLYKDIDFVWIYSLKECLSSMVDLHELKSLINQKTCWGYLDLEEIELNEEWFTSFDPNSCYKRIEKIKCCDEEKILFAMSKYIALAKNKIIQENKTKENKIDDNTLNNKNNHTKEKNVNNLFDEENPEVQIIISPLLINHLKKLTDISYSDDIITNFIQKIFDIQE